MTGAFLFSMRMWWLVILFAAAKFVATEREPQSDSPVTAEFRIVVSHIDPVVRSFGVDSAWVIRETSARFLTEGESILTNNSNTQVACDVGVFLTEAHNGAEALLTIKFEFQTHTGFDNLTTTRMVIPPSVPITSYSSIPDNVSAIIAAQVKLLLGNL